MSLGLMMHGNWDGLSIANSQLQSYKPERPVYSTPHPVQSTPSNNECKLVELRGAEVASFIIGDDEYICLPQAFDLFLKHLVGGLHTVYTKLKRLSITPVVCNVEQVRVLRGLGAIQPGVNRCKLITRKDFEILYQDCTTASRPGRPPKRYPILPPSELMSHHPGSRAMSQARGILGSPDLSHFHKRMRFDHEANFHQQQARRMSTSPTRRSPPTARKYPPGSGADDLYANAANIYLQQALRQQYQQFIANGLHNGMSSQHAPMNAAALAPLIGMSNPGFFNGAIPPNLLNHINEYARNNSREIMNGTISGEQRGGATSSPRQDKMEVPEKAYRSPSVGSTSHRYENSIANNLSRENKTLSREDCHSKSPPSFPNHAYEVGKGNDESPSTPDSATGRDSIGEVSVSSFDSIKKSPAGTGYGQSPNHDADVFGVENMNQHKFSDIKTGREKLEITGSPTQDNHEIDWQAPSGASNISSMQTLLGNIQGLLKVAADNAKIQDKQLSYEIAELKNKITREQEMRGMIERKLEESERNRASIQRKLNREREAVKRLQEQKLVIHEKLQQNVGNEKSSVDVSSPSEPRSPASQHDSNDLHQQEATVTNIVQVSTTSTPPSEFSPTASSPSVISPASLVDCTTYWNGRTLVDGSHGRRSVSRSPQHNSPVNMSTTERNWMSCNLVHSSSCAK